MGETRESKGLIDWSDENGVDRGTMKRDGTVVYDRKVGWSVGKWKNMDDAEAIQYSGVTIWWENGDGIIGVYCMKGQGTVIADKEWCRTGGVLIEWKLDWMNGSLFERECLTVVRLAVVQKVA